MAIIKNLRKRGFTLVELMIVVVIIGILAALAIYGVQKYVANAKSAEARMAVGRMSKDGAAYFEAEKMAGNTLTLGGSVGVSRQLCPAATAVPSTGILAEGVKRQPSPTEWTGNGWNCLKFSMTQPVYFLYNYQSNVTTTTAAAAANDWFTASGQASLGGTVKKIYQNAIVDTSQGMVLRIAPALCDTEGAFVAALQDANGDCAE